MELVSDNVKKMLGVEKKVEEVEGLDVVVWEGDAVGLGASVVAAVDGQLGKVTSCWPQGSGYDGLL